MPPYEGMGRGLSLPPMPLRQFQLANGLTVILAPDPSSPIVAVDVSYDVGSKDDHPSRTGAAHFFEHLMFEGATHHPGSFSAALEEFGGFCNGATGRDRTHYWSVVPPEHLGQLLWLEADRMGYLRYGLSEEVFAAQRGVVISERLEKYESRPGGIARERLQQLVFGQDHPYAHPVIGWMEDIQAMTREDVVSFYDRFYGPANASIAIAGAIDPDVASELVERYFGPLCPRAPGRREYAQGLPLAAERVVMQDQISSPRSILAFRTPAFLEQDDATADLLAFLLVNPQSGRLREKWQGRLVHDVVVQNSSRKLAGVMTVDVDWMGEPKDLNELFREELASMVSGGLDPSLVREARGQIQMEFFYALSRKGGFGGTADLLNAHQILAGDAGSLHRDFDRYNLLEVDDIAAYAARLIDSPAVQVDVVPGKRLPVSVCPLKRPPASASRLGEPADNPPLAAVSAPTRQSTGLPFSPLRGQTAKGIPVWKVLRPQSPLVAMEYLVPTGGRVLQQPGVQRIVEQLVDGTFEERRETTRRWHEANSELVFDISGRDLRVGFVGHRDSVEVSTALVRKYLDRRRFDPQEFGRVRERLSHRLAGLATNPHFLAQTAMAQLLYGKDSLLGRPRYPSSYLLSHVTLQDVEAAWLELVEGASSSILVAGGYRDTGFVDSLPKFVGRTLSTENTLEQPDIGRFHLLCSGLRMTKLVLGWRLPPRGHEDDPALTILNRVFSSGIDSRLGYALRSVEGMTYGVRSHLESAEAGSAYVVEVDVNPGRVDDACDIILRELSALLASRPITEAEVDRVTSSYRGKWLSSLENSVQTVVKLRELASFGETAEDLERHLEKIHTLDAETLTLAVRKYLSPQPVILTVGSSATGETIRLDDKLFLQKL